MQQCSISIMETNYVTWKKPFPFYEFCDEAVKLLNGFDSKVDPSQLITL